MCDQRGPWGVGDLVCTIDGNHPPGCSFQSGECIPSQEKSDGGGDDE